MLTKCGFLIVGEGREFAHGRNEETDEVVLRLMHDPTALTWASVLSLESQSGIKTTL